MKPIMADKILDCGHKPSPHKSFTTGYGYDREGKTHCYDCCAANERQNMLDTGRATLYLVKESEVTESEAAKLGTLHHARWAVTDWPGKLRFPVYHAPRKGAHNMARTRYDVWFTGPDGKRWHGVQYGEWTQLCHCRRLKGE